MQKRRSLPAKKYRMKKHCVAVSSKTSFGIPAIEFLAVNERCDGKGY